jgi:hypothetical protein
MIVDRCDFQVPPATPGWYGILSETGSKAAFWDGTDGLSCSYLRAINEGF